MIYINTLFTNYGHFQLSVLLIGAFLFLTIAIRELKNEEMNGLLAMAFGFFFLCVHAILLWNLPNPITLANFNIWNWLTGYLAPALIVLYVLLGFFNLLTVRFNLGMVRLFFGLTLYCYLYMLGNCWPIDVRGILVLIWGGIWFDIGIRAN
jgi:hypothetical protein